MLKKDFWYDLPKELIAQEPAEPRDAARLMVLDRRSDAIRHAVFHDLPQYLEKGDLLVVNNSKVLPARLLGTKVPTGAVCELLLLRQVKGDTWECLARPGKRLHTGTEITFGDGTLTDFTLEVEIKLEGRTGTSTAGIVFRAGNYAASPYDSYTSMQGYYLAINNNQIVLESLNYADGTQSVGTFVQGNPFAQSDVFIPVKIQVRGNNIKIWSGDTLMIDATDPFGFVNGKIGLYTNGAAAVYRNLKIYE